jgi:LPXTG-site transpeptidase (sortase) family protein
MYKKVLNGILIVLLIAIIGTLGYLGYQYFTAYKNEKDAEKFLNEEFETLIVDLNQKQPEEQPQENSNEQSGNNQNSGNQNSGNYYNNSNSGYYRGYKVAGKIEMPTIGKQFPILDEPEKASAMDVSVVKVYGPDLNTPGNAVIGGHNNNNGTFFSRNKNLNIGDKVYITDLSGRRVTYTIYEKFYTPGTDSTWFNRQTNGQTEVTLYTCDATGVNRLVIYARADN